MQLYQFCRELGLRQWLRLDSVLGGVSEIQKFWCHLERQRGRWILFLLLLSLMVILPKSFLEFQKSEM